MARVDHPALGHIQAGGAVQGHALQGAAQLGLVVVLEDLIHALLGPLVVEGLLLRVHPAQHRGDVQIDHGVGQSPAGPGLGDGLGPHAGGIFDEALIQAPDQVIGPTGPLQALLLSGHPVVLRVGDGVESLREAVAALAQGLAVGGDGKVLAAARLAVDAVLLHEVQAALAGLQPLLFYAVHMAQIGKCPGATPLHPHALIGGEHLPLPVQTGIHPAMHRVHAVFQPEMDASLQLLLDPFLVALQPNRQIHIRIPPFYILRETALVSFIIPIPTGPVKGKAENNFQFSENMLDRSKKADSLYRKIPCVFPTKTGGFIQ